MSCGKLLVDRRFQEWLALDTEKNPDMDFSQMLSAQPASGSTETIKLPIGKSECHWFVIGRQKNSCLRLLVPRNQERARPCTRSMVCLRLYAAARKLARLLATQSAKQWPLVSPSHQPAFS